MAKNKLDMLGPLLNEIGQVVADVVGGDPNGIFLYVEVGDGWISPNLYKDEGEVVRDCEITSPSLTDLIWEAWHLEPEGPNMRWSVMEYSVENGKFDVRFKYPGEVDVEAYDHDDARREAALRTRYGDKPVIYPPPPKGAFELTP
ncbi:hypothetical protein [Sphingobium chlorophenolicum]|uniref:Uncharacterized protein n=1 Tax=Sphingobium chlorophenolicum TaxID=46429 RepID=A0A081R8X4_SPHCR|nr:hypothetical protein [Sphingobium chlorophenolicum]KEQ51647.1 hypothetical protein BV95_04075 [Sphingobium chlorophenolicum]